MEYLYADNNAGPETDILTATIDGEQEFITEAGECLQVAMRIYYRHAEWEDGHGIREYREPKFIDTEFDLFNGEDDDPIRFETLSTSDQMLVYNKVELYSEKSIDTRSEEEEAVHINDLFDRC